MAIHHAVLSLLDRSESYGYELKGAFERAVGPQWGELNIGHLYQVLERLKRDGMVAVVRAEPQPRRPDRLIYAITPDGREELRRWLETPAAPAAGYRDDLYLKLVAAARDGDATLRAVVRRERQALMGELHALRAGGAGDPLSELLVDGAALQVEARLRLLDSAEADAARLAESAQPQQVSEARGTSRARRAGGTR